MTKHSKLKDKLQTQTGLELRAVNAKDADIFFKAIHENQNHFLAYDFTQPKQRTLQEVLETISDLENYKQQNMGAYYGGWVEDQLVGLFTINGIDWQEHVADVGYWLVARAMGKGFAGAGLQTLVDYCLKDLKMELVTAHVATSNVQSQKVLLKAGFQNKGIAEGGMRVRDTFVDQYLYVKWNEDWDEF